MSSREQILGRIREALKRPAPFPGSHPVSHAGTHARHDSHSQPEQLEPGTTHAREGSPMIPLRPSLAARPWLPPGGTTPEEQWERFCIASAELKTTVQEFATAAEAHARLGALAAEKGWTTIASHRGMITDAATAALGLSTLLTDGGYPVHDLEKCSVGITECDALVAQTGSILVTSRSTGGRALSVLPPHHLVLARRNQLVPDLGTALEWAKVRYAPKWPSMISFITGPSRTGDIERILVLGAHGPRELTVFLLP